MSRDSRKTSNMSIEDILKSIRKIIDNRSSSKEDKPAHDEVLELTSMLKEEEAEANSPQSIEVTQEKLISDKSAAEVSGMFKELADKANSVIKDNKKNKCLTIEELVIEMLRPQLKKWLNDNLPTIVQQLVEKEIKRLIPDE